MMLSILLLASVSVQASPVNFGEVASVLGGFNNRAPIDRLHLRAVTQDPSAPASPNGGTNTLTASASSVGVIDGVGPQNAQPSLIAGTEVAAQDSQQVNVEVFEQDNVDGTICDCGEIPSAGGFSKWWLLALVPLVCVTGICHHEKECVTCPTPTPTPPPVPEPTTLLLLGSGLAALGAGARRRYAKARGKNEAATTEEV
jgi:hypothetical protein